MPFEIVISKRAEKHIQKAYNWYEERRAGLGDMFLSVLDSAILSIKSNPFSYGIRRKSLRGCIKKDYPYLIYFYTKGSVVKVVAVFHMSRRPMA